MWTSESVRGSRAGPSSRLPHPRRGRPGPGKRLGQRHHGITRLAHRRAEVLMRRRLEPAAEVLLLGQQVAQRLGDGRMVARQADPEQRPDELPGRVDRARARARCRPRASRRRRFEARSVRRFRA